MVEIMIVVVIIGLLASIAIPAFHRARLTTFKNVCINNLRLLESAKEQWAMEEGVPSGVTPAGSDLEPYIKGFSAGGGGGGGCGGGGGGRTHILFCPVDPAHDFSASYNLNPVGQAPTCKIVPSTHVN